MNFIMKNSFALPNMNDSYDKNHIDDDFIEKIFSSTFSTIKHNGPNNQFSLIKKFR